jgi:hypothetical protein
MLRWFVSSSVFLALVLFCLCARAEVFLLKSGGRIEGEHLNPDREPAEPYQLRTMHGVRLDLAPTQVERMIVKSDVQTQYEHLLPKVPNSAEGHWQMAQWCKEAGLTAERKRHLAEVIARESDHAEARAALGYSKFGSRWMTQDEFMRGQGYVRSKGAWRLQQEVDLDAIARDRELKEKAYRRDIKRWFEQLGGRLGDEALENLKTLRDPLAAPAISEILADSSNPRDMREFCLDMLAKLPPGLANATLIKLAMEDPDANIRDRCLDELHRIGAADAVAKFQQDLKSKDNKRVNRAGWCLQRMSEREATLSLIDALVTKHEFIINPDGGSGGGGTPINFNAGGGPGQGGLGGLSMGSKAKRVKMDLKNKGVLDALAYLHPGVNYQYDEDAWRKWYIETFTTTRVDLRRDK